PQMKSIIVFVLLSSGALAGKIGVVSLIAKGYGALSIALILVYVVPVTFWVIRAAFSGSGSGSGSGSVSETKREGTLS
ncbi:MAG: hypothetical protein NWR63_05695, partial [OM182 bacterium]|nr:hypothetical protein [OM182 bacterium]